MCGAAGGVQAVLNGRRLGTFSVPGDVHVFAADGHDLLTINGAPGVDEFDIQSGTVVVNDRAIVAPDVESRVINGKANNDTFRIWGGLAVISGNGGQDTLIANAPGDHLWLLNDPGAGAVNGVAFTGFENLEGGSGDDVFVIQDDARVAGTLDARGGADTLDYSPIETVVTIDRRVATLPRITGAVVGIEMLVGGSSADDRLIGPNTSITWELTGPDEGTLVGAFAFAGFERLTGGTGTDRFIVGAEALMTGPIAGGGGSDTLDYSSHTAPVSVDLAAGVATGIASFSAIPNVIGGAANDTLAGNGISNRLEGGAGDDTITGAGGDDNLLGGAGDDAIAGGGGNDVIDGGAGVDSLSGDAGNDILAGATGDDVSRRRRRPRSPVRRVRLGHPPGRWHERRRAGRWIDGLRPRISRSIDLTALTALRNEWSRTDLGYAERVALLDDVLNATTVTDDASPDVLTGGSGSDWFLASLTGLVPDTFTTARALEIVTDIP